MDDNNTPDPTKRPVGAADSDPLDLGFGDDGLEQLIGRSDAALDDELFKDLDFGDPKTEPAAPIQADDPQDTPAQDTSPPMPRAETFQPDPTPSESQLPSITDHLMPRAEPLPIFEQEPEPERVAALAPPSEAESAIAEDDLLAAMDALELDEPAVAQAAPALAAPAVLARPAASAAAPIAADPTPVFAAPRDDTMQREPLANDFGAGDYELDEAFPSFEELDDADADAINEPRGGLPKAIIFGLTGLVILGIGGVIGFGLLSGDDGNSGAPQVIAAAEGEDKVEPEATEDTQARPGDAAFEALDGEQTETSSGPRVVLPAPNTGGLPLQDGQQVRGADIAPAAPGSTASRAVRTVTVRADGTVVETNSAAATATPASEAPILQVEPGSARPVEVVAVTPNGVQTPATQELADRLNQVTERVRTLDVGQPSAQPSVQTTTTTPPSPVPAPTQLAAPAANQQAQTQPTQLAVAPTPAPAATASPAPAATPASVPAGDFIVQLASLRSDQEARDTFSRLQNRFGSILGGFGPNIQRADLGDRGVYHRVRVGPMDRAAADSLCRRYQSAGGDCFVQRQ